MSPVPPLYPLKFKPILKPKVWGGDRLTSVLKKEASDELIGESWEISAVKGDVSVVDNGPLSGMGLDELIDTYGRQLLGERVLQKYEGKFPLLFKFIDAREDLSVQLHPDDQLAQKRHESFGKTEMWYIVDTTPEARLIIGFNQEMDKSKYLEHLANGTLVEILNSAKIKPGDTYFIAPGTVHAIGAGTLLAEIQQTSDITYRIYDWNRPDVNGEMRELHTDLALDAIDFSSGNALQQFQEKDNEAVLLCKSEYFETNKLSLTHSLTRNIDKRDSFSVYMCVEGEVVLESGDWNVPLNKGETVLVPAALKEVRLDTKSVTLLEIYIP